MIDYGTDYDQVSLGYVLAEIDAQRGFSVATANQTEWIRNALLINQCGNEIWTKVFWPELINTEQRTYRVPWKAGVANQTGDEVWREDDATNFRHYCRSLVDGNLVDPEADFLAGGTNWLIDPPDFIPYIDFVQPWESTTIEGVELKRFASRWDPRYVSEPAYIQNLLFIRKRVVFPRVDCWMDEEGYYAPQGSTTTSFQNMRGTPLKPWVQFRPPWPEIGGVVYDNTRSYAAGEHAYAPTDGIGTCYLCIQPCQGVAPNSSTTNWQPIGIPKVFARYIILWTAAQRMSESDGKYRIKADADHEAERLEAVLMEQTGVGARVVYNSGR